MKNRSKSLLRGAGSIAILLTAVRWASAAVTDYAKPMIGTAEHGHVFPGATVPFGMVQVSPDTRDGSEDDPYQDGAAGYHYSDTSVMGFSHNHLTGTGIGDLGNVLLIPTVGELKLVAGRQPGQGYRARFSHDQEEARPGYYRVFLPDYKVNVELTATRRVGVHRYSFPEAADSHIILDLWHGIGRATASFRKFSVACPGVARPFTTCDTAAAEICSRRAVSAWLQPAARISAINSLFLDCI